MDMYEVHCAVRGVGNSNAGAWVAARTEEEAAYKVTGEHLSRQGDFSTQLDRRSRHQGSPARRGEAYLARHFREAVLRRGLSRREHVEAQPRRD